MGVGGVALWFIGSEKLSLSRTLVSIDLNLERKTLQMQRQGPGDGVRGMAFQLVRFPLWAELHYEGVMRRRSGQRLGGNGVEREDISVQDSSPEI